MDHTKTNRDFFLKQFGIKPCSVNLNRTVFSKIRIRCSAKSSEENVKLLCDLKQLDSNTFTIKLKRKIIDDIDIVEETPPQKKAMIGETSTHQLNDSIVENISC